MDLKDEVIYDIEGIVRIYKSGRVDRFVGNGSAFVPPSTDSITGISFKDVKISSHISARVYHPKIDSNKKLPILIHYHGGAFCVGSAFEAPWHNYVSSLASKANVLAISVQYRLAPEHPIPVSFEDSYAALDWVVSYANGGSESWIVEHGDLNRVFVSGESAGGNIVHHVAMYGGAKIRGAVLIHPYFLSSKKVDSEDINPILTTNLVNIWKIVHPNTTGLEILDDPWINPLANEAPPLVNLLCNRVLVLVGGMDVLRDRGKAYYETLKESDWKGDIEIWEANGEGHCFHFDKPLSEVAKEQDRIIVGFLNKM